MSARVQTLPEVSLRWVIQNKSSPSLRVIKVRPYHGALAPRDVAFSSRCGSLGSGRALPVGTFERRRTKRHDGLALLGLLGPSQNPQIGIP